MAFKLNVKRKLMWLAGCMLATGIVTAQTPSDAVMMDKGQICVGAFYTNSSWNEYWEGDSLRTNDNIGTVTTQMINGGFQLGILDRINLFVMVPYVWTKSTPVENPISGLTTATLQGEHGFQDIALLVKGSILQTTLGKGTLDILATVGATLPVTDYTPDATFPIGLACPDGIFRGIVQYSADMGIYGRIDGAYHLRGNSELIRTYYYSTGGYYTNEVDMPDAMDYNATLGYITKDETFKVEAQLSGLTTFGGFDIRRQDMGFPSNEMDAMRIGINADYYDLFTEGFGIHFMSAYTLSGRNVGKSMMLGGGLTYVFPLWGGSSEASDSQTN